MSAFQVNGSPRAYIASSLRERTSTVHPHACGEHIVSSSTRTRSFGSSPRMWGTQHDLPRIAVGDRFIPTHVGNTVSQFHLIAARAVHPHACGEHKYCNDISPRYDGSSPRMWGTRNRRPGEELCIRFIPTHVGNTSWQPSRLRRMPVHPHACGEHNGYNCRCRIVAGSSPRMWGTHLPYRIVFKEEKTPRKIYRLILYSVVRSRGWNATNCSPSNNTGCRRLTPRVWNS